MFRKVFAVVFALFFIFNSYGQATRTTWLDGNTGSFLTWTCLCVPASTDNVVINDSVTVTGNTIYNNVTINSGGVLYTDGGNLTVNGNLIIAAGGKMVSNNLTSLNGNYTNFGEHAGSANIRLQKDTAYIFGDGIMSNTGRFQLYGSYKVFGPSVDMYFEANRIQLLNSVYVLNNGSVSTVNLDGNGSRTWENGPNSTLDLRGTMTTTIVFDADAIGNTVKYSRLGGTNVTITDPIGSTYYNLVIDGDNLNSLKRLSNHSTILGDLTINGSTFDVRLTLDWNFDLRGNWYNNGGKFNPRIGKVVLNGTTTQIITGLVDETFNNLEVNKASGDILLGVNLNVDDELVLNGGKIITGANKVSLGSGLLSIGTLVLYSDYIQGNLERWLNSTGTPYLFPIGTASSYRPATVTFNNLTSGKLLTAFNPSFPGDDGLPLADGADSVRNTFIGGFWEMTNSNGLSSSSFDLTLTANGFTSYIINSSTRLLSRVDSNSNWIVDGTHLSASSPDVNRNGLTFLPAQFAIGDTTKCTLPAPPTLSIIGADSVCTNTSNSIYSVTNTPGSTYLWVINGGVKTSGGSTNTIGINWGLIGSQGSVKVTEYNGCEYGTPVQKNVAIHSLPVDTIFGQLIVDENQNGIAYSVTQKPGYSYNWNIVGGTQASGGNSANITVNWGSAGAASVSVTGTTACGNSVAYVLSVGIVDFINSVSSGNWSTAFRWDCNCIPSITSNVIISAGHLITLTQNTSANSIRIESGATFSDGGNRFAITENLQNNGNYTGTNRLEINGTGNTISGTGSFAFHSGVIRFNVGVHTITSNVSINKTGDVEVRANTTVINYGNVQTSNSLVGSNNTTSNWYNESNSTLKVSQNLLNTGNLYASANGNTVGYNRTGNNNQSIKNPVNSQYYHLIIDGDNTSSIKSLTSNTQIIGDVSISLSTFDVTLSSHTITLYGNWNNTSGVFNRRSGTVIFAGVNQQINHPTLESFYNLQVSNSGILTLNSNINVGQGLTIDLNGSLDVGAGNRTINLSRNFTNSGSFIERKGLMNMNGTAQQIINGNATFYNLTINNAAGVIINSGQINLRRTLTLTNGTFGTVNNLTLLSNATETARIAQITGGNITGNVTVERYIGYGVYNWRLLSSPVSGITLAQWDDDMITSGFPGSDYPTFPFVSIMRYNETHLSVKDSGYYAPTNITNPMVVGAGYSVYSGISNTGPSPFSIEVVGVPNKGTLSIPVTYTNSGSALDDGWNLVGNPYASTIDWNAGGWTKTKINNAVYVWDASQQQYTSYIGGVSTNGGSRYIPSSQAFWVQSNANLPVLTIVESVKADTNHAFLRQSAPNDLVKMKLKGTTFSDEAVIQIAANAGTGFDAELDSRKLYSTNAQVPSISSFSDSIEFAVNSISKLTSDAVIPVKTKVPVNGSYKISFELSQLNNDFSCLIFRDLLLNTAVSINTDTSFNLYLYNTASSPRFELTLGAPLVTTIDSVTCHNSKDGAIHAVGKGTGPWNYQWTDYLGQVIKTRHSHPGPDTLENLQAGTYSVTVGNSGICVDQSSVVELDNPDPIISSFTMSHDTVKLSDSTIVHFQNLSENATSFTWNFDDGITSTDQDPEHVFQTSGTKTVELTSSHSVCSEKSQKLIHVVENATGIPTTMVDLPFEIYSFENVLTVKGMNNNKSNVEITIFNNLGQELHRRSIGSGVINETFENPFGTGIWIVRITSDMETMTKEVIIQ